MVLFFLAVIWFILPFVVLGIRGCLDRALDLLEGIDRWLAALESRISAAEAPEAGSPPGTPPSGPPPAVPRE
jgi:hypothetical protein